MVDNNKCEIVDSLNFLDKRIANKINFITAAIGLVFVAVSSTIISMNGFNTNYLFLLLILLILATIPHELFHYVLQWIFSRRKPHLGFKFPFPYSALAPEASINRNQAIIVALAPAFILTIIIVLPAFFVSFLPKIILITWACIELDTCYGDFFMVNWLRKYPSNVRLKNVNLVNVLYKIVKTN